VRPDPAPPAAPHPRRALLLNVALSVAVTALVVTVAEGLARRFEPPARPRALADTRGLDWQAEWQGDFYVVKSDAVGWPLGQDFNRDGLRDRPHPLDKPAGTYRVACLGDSVTFGYGFTRAESWPHALQDLVDARGPGVEVLSVALPGWSTRQERYAYERIARRYRPDAVVLAVVLNDMEDLHNNLSQPPAWLVGLFKRSALVRRVTNAEGREIRSVDELFVQPESRAVASGYERLFAEIRALAADVRADGAALQVVVLPDADQVGPRPPAPIPQERIGAFLRAEGIGVVDPLPGLRDVGPEGFLDRLHFTPRGSTRVAEAVRARIPESAYSPSALRAALSARGEMADVTQAPATVLAPLTAAASPEVRRQAAWALGRQRATGPEAGAALTRALDDAAPAVRVEAARALAAVGSEARGTPATDARLIALLDDPLPEVRWAAANALDARGIHGAADVPWLARALRHSDPYVRGFAAWTLGVAGPAAGDAAPALQDALRDPEPGVRALAVRALGNLGRSDAPVVAALADVVAHGSGEGRWRALRALAKLGPSAAPAVGVMAQALADPDEKVRRESALALDRVGPPASAAVPALVAAQRDAVPEVRDAATQALRTITAAR
jgi:HEAT repeat protein/lysophospholipase L1-like esterase